MSSTFLDGPAAGVTLLFRRTPVLLRVVCKGGEWDVLDRLEDTPKRDEQMYAYVRVTTPFEFHLCRRGARDGGSGWYRSADYRLHPEQPPDHVMRRTPSWRAWCEEVKRAALAAAKG